jgi:hypothetical protein
MQVDLHPDVSRLIKRFGRWHHFVDYQPFKANTLRRKAGATKYGGPDNYGMVLILAGAARELAGVVDGQDPQN